MAFLKPAYLSPLLSTGRGAGVARLEIVQQDPLSLSYSLELHKCRYVQEKHIHTYPYSQSTGIFRNH